MQFTKMHGIGNDYIYVNGFEESVTDPASLARAVSDRHFGIGGDGLVLILPSDTADVRMRMFNADGSEGMMCGNAIRCVAKFSHERGLAEMNPVKVETASGIKTIDKIFTNGDCANNNDKKVSAATVDMGEPILVPADVPVALPNEQAEPIVNMPIEACCVLDNSTGWMEAAGLEPAFTCVSMGNPHAVLFCKDVDAVPLETVGPIIENAKIFPNRINAHFVQVIGDGELKMRTWERGSGITWACGTGASAVCVAGVLTGKSSRAVLVHLAGGDLNIEWRESDNHVFMTGPATEVFSGEWVNE